MGTRRSRCRRGVAPNGGDAPAHAPELWSKKSLLLLLPNTPSSSIACPCHSGTEPAAQVPTAARNLTCARCQLGSGLESAAMADQRSNTTGSLEAQEDLSHCRCSPGTPTALWTPPAVRRAGSSSWQRATLDDGRRFIPTSKTTRGT